MRIVKTNCSAPVAIWRLAPVPQFLFEGTPSQTTCPWRLGVVSPNVPLFAWERYNGALVLRIAGILASTLQGSCNLGCKLTDEHLRVLGIPHRKLICNDINLRAALSFGLRPDFSESRHASAYRGVGWLGP